MTIASPAKLELRDALDSMPSAARDRAQWLLSDSAGGAFPWYLAAPARRRRLAYLGVPGAGALDGCRRFASGALVTSDPDAARLARSVLAEAGAAAFFVVAPEKGRVPLPDGSFDVVVAGPGSGALGVPLASEALRLVAPGGVVIGDASRRCGLFAPAVPGEPLRPRLGLLPRAARLFPQEPGRRGPVALRGFPGLAPAPRPRGLRARLREALLARPALARSLVATTDAAATAIDALLEKYPPRAPRVEISPTGLLAWFGPGVRVEVPVTLAAAERARRNAERLLALAARSEALGPLAALAPRLADSGAIEGVEYCVEALRPGATLASRADRLALAPRAIDLLSDFHVRTARRVTLAGEPLERLVRRPVLALLGFGVAGDGVRRLADAAARALDGLSIPLVLAHGDFGPGNVLVDSANGVPTGVIDWDLSEDDAAPFADAAHFATRLASLPIDRFREAPGDLLARYAGALSLGGDGPVRDALALTGFSRARLAHLATDRPYDPAWVAAEVAAPVARFLEALR